MRKENSSGCETLVRSREFEERLYMLLFGIYFIFMLFLLILPAFPSDPYLHALIAQSAPSHLSIHRSIQIIAISNGQ
ncbi:hypothetical protein EYC84_001001 [Monilinia fructicola]|uniref:Uncharacterized protein n=1 Tax=Monilinia fructicola TaxID=38448 RepID=A0A5M9JMZ2_MONFR|nr:hypothetical protein EYC84_001001 [Monilinia fructicola]